ncbi:helix-turn-helix domain-containing protein [uncultured Veillonella sp.]|uniref:helix-turn-helix domain-containing protein n=1 Tax=uncultured Veillonella sp. TaxID=159268 RepID=UPI0025FB6667|nr:helix-turn-helix transcriptional regulator [uncultured Veillonella sp.]
MEAKHGTAHRLIGAKIAYCRSVRGLTQSELAERIGISSGTLSRIERGQYWQSLSVDLLLDIAEALQVEVSAFLHPNELD